MFKINHKAQAALEFMMTYGWAMLLLLAVIGGMAYFMPKTSTLTPEKCVFGSALPCLGAQLTSNNLTVVLRNGLGQTVYNISANVTMPMITNCSVINSTISADQRITIVCPNNGVLNLIKDTRINMQVIYQKSRTGYSQEILGDIYAKKQ